jgi:hypothetical protein
VSPHPWTRKDKRQGPLQERDLLRHLRTLGVRRCWQSEHLRTSYRRWKVEALHLHMGGLTSIDDVHPYSASDDYPIETRSSAR